MTVTFEQSLQDIYDWVEHQRGKRKQEFPLRAIITLVIIGYGFLQRGQNTIAWVLIAIALSLAAGPLLAKQQLKLMRRQAISTEKVAEQAPDSLRIVRTLTMEESGLRIAEPNQHKETVHYWAALREITELERIVAVRIGMETLLIPKRAFETPEAYTAFVTELRGKLPTGEAEETPSGES